ncbi:MAG TPA: hypothetical protein VMP08_16060, partial [Anaerolineae bacterium]|nr:hypothetical protein [Anaerolineae bacterium]
MTQRSMLAGPTPTIVVRAVGSVTVEGWESDRIQADSDSRWGVQIERRKAAQIGRERARAAVGDRVLFDITFDNPFNRTKRLPKDFQGEVIEVQLGGDGQVHVPRGSHLAVYAGRNAEVHHLRDRVTATAGRDLHIHDVQVLIHAAAGGDLDLDCATLEGDAFTFSSGRDLRFYIHDLTDAQILIKDAGSYWVAVLGNGRLKVRLKAGGDVTLITDQEVKPQPPDYTLGNIERPT